MTVQRSSDSGMDRRSSKRADTGPGAHADTHPRADRLKEVCLAVV